MNGGRAHRARREIFALLVSGLILLTHASAAMAACATSGSDDTCLIDFTTDQSQPIDAQGGIDTFQLGNVLDFNFDVSKIGTTYTNFEIFEKTSISTVTLNGIAGTGINWTVKTGELVAATPGSIGNNSFITIDPSATFSLVNANAAGNATFSNSGNLRFRKFSTAQNAQIVNFGLLQFADVSSAGNATITNNGTLSFLGFADASSAQVNTSFGSLVDISGAAAAVSIAALGGSGNINLGSNTLIVGSSNANTTLSGSISGIGGALTKVGTETLTLPGSLYSYTGPTTVQQGELALTGAVGHLFGPLAVGAGARFNSDGIIGGVVTNAGTIAPRTGTLATLTFQSDYHSLGGSLEMDVATDLGARDLLEIFGNVTGMTTLNILPTGTPVSTTGDGIELVRVGGSVSPDAFQLPGGAFVYGGYQFTLAFVPGAANDSFFLQSSAREELYGHAALLSAGRTMLNACFRSDERNAGIADVARSGRAWASYTGGNRETGADTGLKTDQDFSCGAGGIDIARGPDVRLGVSGGYGNSSVDVTTLSGLAMLDGDQSIVEAYAAYAREKVFMTLSVGYATTDWTFDGSQPAIVSATADGVVATAQLGIRWPLGAFEVGLSGGISYDGTTCGGACLVAGTTEETSDWLAQGTLRVDAAIVGGLVAPYAAISIADSLDDGNRVAMDTVAVHSDAASALFAAEAGLTVAVNDSIALFAGAGMTESLDNDVSGYHGQGGLKLQW